GVDAKVHYPIPMHLQPAAKNLGHRRGDFPMAERTCETTLSLPVHEFIQEPALEKMVSLIQEFYR
ncbi:MAG: DegT/DnrJ/EryC1/StrS family aminotransferase, partial [Gammaproteobacteria bacterium]|nr:DegT/DnrJ/EryC1/StrS family aminotransferase [Gammaproteobacteria bacterium]